MERERYFVQRGCEVGKGEREKMGNEEMAKRWEREVDRGGGRGDVREQWKQSDGGERERIMVMVGRSGGGVKVAGG